MRDLLSSFYSLVPSMAMTEVGKEAIWPSGSINELGFKQNSMVLYCDS